MHVVTLSGSPSSPSRSAALLRHIERRLAGHAARVDAISLRDLPAQDLLLANAEAPAIRAAVAQVLRADLLVVATPVNKAAYSGLLKVFIDLLPPDALRGKTVWPLATGGSPAHMLALEYALKPVLAALGARQCLDAVYVLDSQWCSHPALGPVPQPEVAERIEAALLAQMAPVFDAGVPAPC